jgi:hypothetical protein
VNCANAPPGRLIPKLYWFWSNRLTRHWSGNRKGCGRYGLANPATPRFLVTEHLTLEHLRLQHAGSQGGRNLGNGSRPAAKSTVRSIMNFFRKRNPQVLLVSQDWIRCHRAGATFVGFKVDGVSECGSPSVKLGRPQEYGLPNRNA